MNKEIMHEYLELENVKSLSKVLSKNFTKEDAEEISCLIKYMIDDAIDNHEINCHDTWDKDWMHT